MPQLHYAQLRYLSIIVLTWLAVFVLTRSLLLISHLAAADVSLLQWGGVYGVGLVYDLSFLLYATLPLALYLLVCPARLWCRRWHQRRHHSRAGHTSRYSARGNVAYSKKLRS